MMDEIMEMFSYPFIVRAVVVGVMVSLCASLLGVNLVLKRYANIGDGLSHVGFGALSIALSLNALPAMTKYFRIEPLPFTIVMVVLLAFLILRISENSKINSDSAIALVSTASFTIGVMFISMTTGMNTDVCNTLFGTILAMSKRDVYLSVVLSAVVLFLYIFFYHKIFAITFDENFARATGIRVNIYNMLLALLTAFTIVLGMRIMGSLLISSIVVIPALSSMRLFKTYKLVIVSSAVLSVVCFLVGITISYMNKTPTGASVVAVNLTVFFLVSATAYFKRSILR
ncbi:MAG: metal ABC transporter permease [Acidobacteriota bacterium]|nr:metal ABC transporter permease [Acidobacteriota bacterium]